MDPSYTPYSYSSEPKCCSGHTTRALYWQAIGCILPLRTKNQIGIAVRSCGCNGLFQFGLMAYLLQAIHNQSILLKRFCEACRCAHGWPSQSELRYGLCSIMINKIVGSIAEALKDVKDGAVVMIGGFGNVGQPRALIDGLIEQGAGDLTVVANNAGNGQVGLARLIALGRVRKVICSFPRSIGSVVFDQLYREGKIELELVPQGTLAERIRAAGAGVTAFYTPTAVGTKLAQGKEVREVNGKTGPRGIAPWRPRSCGSMEGGSLGQLDLQEKRAQF